MKTDSLMELEMADLSSQHVVHHRIQNLTEGYPMIQKINDAYSILSIKQYVICARLICQNIIMQPSLIQILHRNQAASH